MPTLTTVGGGSLRSFGRGIEQVPAMLPANTIMLIPAPGASLPSGWTMSSTYQGYHFVGTATQAEINNQYNASGSALVTFTTTTSSAHTIASAQFYPGGSGSFLTYNASAGAHTHNGSSSVDCSTVEANTISIVAAQNSSNSLIIPAGCLVFRSIAPTSLNFTQYTPTGNGYYYGHSSLTAVSFTSKTNTTASGTTVPAAGNHSHTGSSALYAQTLGIPYGGNYATSAGNHSDHAFTVAMTAACQSRFLKAWISTVDEAIEYGMIVMYGGDIGKLPAGWRVCDGTLGTPNMVNYALTHRSDFIHGATVSAGLAVTTVGGTVGTTTSNWSHTHSSSYDSSYRGTAGYHTLGSAPHSHTLTMTGVSTSTYTPKHVKVAFIQYKGI